MAVSGAPSGQQHSAFHEHVVPQIDVLYRVALAMTGQPADAEDLVQDTLVRAFRAIARFDGAHPRAWLLTILRNTHINRGRRQRPVLFADSEHAARALDLAAPPAPAAEEVVVGELFEAVVADALAGLPDKHRAVVTLVDIQGLSYQQAADALGIPRGTVMSRLHRARARIRGQLVSAGSLPAGRSM